MITLEEIKNNLSRDKQKDKEYLISVHNEFLSNCKDKKDISEFVEMFVEHLNEEERKQYFKKVNSSLDGLQKQIDECFGKGKWADVIKLVDENIYKVQMPRMIEDRIQYQHPNPLNAIAYSLRHKGVKVDDINHDEFMLLNKKIIALIKLGEYATAEEVISFCEELAPDNFGSEFQRLEILKDKGETNKILPFLDNILDEIWFYESFAYALKEYANFYESEGDIKSAIYYLNYSLIYDDLDYENTKNKIEKLSQESNITVPTEKTEMIKYFKSNKMKYEVSKESALLAYELYDCILNYKKFDKTIEQLAKTNLIKLYANAPEIAEMIEVKHRTDNKLIVDYSYGFSFQVNKKFNKTDLSNNNLYVQNFDSEDFSFILEIDKNNCQLNEFQPLFDKYQKMQSQDSKVVDTLSVELPNGQIVLVAKAEENNQKFENFYFRARPNVVAKIKTKIEKWEDSNQDKIIPIIGTIKFLGLEQSAEQQDLFAICVLGKGVGSLNGEEKEQAKKLLISKIEDFATKVFALCELEDDLIRAGKGLLKLLIVCFINNRYTIEAFDVKFLHSVFAVNEQQSIDDVLQIIYPIMNVSQTNIPALAKPFYELSKENKIRVLSVLSAV